MGVEQPENMKLFASSVIMALVLNAQTSFALRGKAKDSVEEHATALKEVLDSSPFTLDELLEEIEEPRELKKWLPTEKYFKYYGYPYGGYGYGYRPYGYHGRV